MTEPFLLSVFNEVRQDESLIDPGLEAYFLAVDAFSKDRHVAGRDFSGIVFFLSSLWLKSRDGKNAFNKIMERRRQTLLAFVNFLNKEEAETPAPQEKEAVQPVAVTEAKNERIKEQPEAAEKKELPAQKGTVQATTKTSPKEKWYGEAAFALSQSAAPAVEVSSPFIMGNDFFPVKDRQLQQAWRALKSRGKGPDSAQISFKMTVYQSARQGIFTDFSYEKEKVNQLRLFILVDRSERMAAVEDFGLELARTVSEVKDHPDVRPWFFVNLPRYLPETDDYVVNDEDMRNFCNLEKLFRDVPQKNRAVLIYSDAGVFGQEWTEKRNESSQKFVKWLLARTGTLAWVNPAPKYRWADEDYLGLRNLVPMFTTDRTDINQAIDALRGKINLKPSPHVA